MAARETHSDGKREKEKTGSNNKGKTMASEGGTPHSKKIVVGRRDITA